MSAPTVTTLSPAQLDQLSINTLRFLSVDAVQKANSGHPGLPLGAAAMAYTLWTRFLRPIMEQRVVYVFTHDSIALGEDGTTHQPVEQIANLRAFSRLVVIRPCDANETAYAWRVALESRDRAVGLILTRQDVPTLDRSRYSAAEGLKRGAYILAEAANARPGIVLIATGSEVGPIVEAQRELEKRNIQTRLVSMPSWELFEAQSEEYRRSVFPPSIRGRLAVEAGATQGWHRYVGDLGEVIGLDHFGASAPGPVLMREYGFTVGNVCNRALALLKKEYA